MNLSEAKQFVALFEKGEYTQGEYAAFLRWLRVAKPGELNAIADAHEAVHEYWDVAGLMPAENWSAGLEERLDRAERVPIRKIGVHAWPPRAWIAAASVILLVVGGAIWYAETGGMGRRMELSASTRSAVNPGASVEKQLVLSDGSRVLLNTASTLKYPETFDGGERVVELSGEAYFEVEPDAARPFRVKIRGAEVDVLGTNFNIRAYADEPLSRTTLSEGSVEMKTGAGSNIILKPGQQAVVSNTSRGEMRILPQIISGVDIDAVMAWKKGEFRYTNEELQVVMRVLSRYYDIEIECDQNIAGLRVSGVVSRDWKLEENLRQFKPIGLKFTQKGKKVEVTQ